jgi:hypothetical protein
MYNSLSDEELDLIVASWTEKKKLRTVYVNGQETYYCAYAPTETKAGTEKYSQFAVLAEWSNELKAKLGGQGAKQLVHCVMWRWIHGGAELDDTKEVSHQHANSRIQMLIEEDAKVNEFRKGCHELHYCCDHHTVFHAGVAIRTATRCPHRPRCYCMNCGPPTEH